MKSKMFPYLVVLLVLAFLAVLIALAFYHPQHSTNQTFTNVFPVRGVRLDYLDMSKSRGEVAALNTQMKQSGVNLVALGAGRVDWTYFPWPGHSDSWSDDVKTSGTDYLLEDSLRFGKWAHVSAVVDVLSPLYIQAHPETASISYVGVPSQNIVATMELVDGKFGQDLLDMIDKIAASYPVNSITISELVYYTDGFGEQDKAAYMAYTGQTDWPRIPDSRQINLDDPSIGVWRSYEIGRFLAKAAEITHKYGKQLFVETFIDEDQNANITVRNGTDISSLLAHADRIIVWGDHNLDEQHAQTALPGFAQFLARYGEKRIIMMIGLWNKSYDAGTPKNAMSSISSEDLRTAFFLANQRGITNLFITPSFLMTNAHWQVLKDLWGK